MMAILKNIFLIFLAVMSCMGDAIAQTKVRVTIVGFENNDGKLLMGVFNDPEQFPYDPFLEFEWPKDTVSNGRLVISITLPGPGNYAFSVLDDKNSSGDMDKNFIGFPKEHYGFSNDARPHLFSPPHYEDCLVKIGQKDSHVFIKLQRKKKDEEE